MRKAIDRKLYDTETATLIGEWSNGHNTFDLNHVWEGLYRTQKGSYFVAGEGGARSKYAEHSGRESSAGSGIAVLTREEAYQWCEEHGCIDGIEAEFADCISEA